MGTDTLSAQMLDLIYGASTAANSWQDALDGVHRWLGRGGLALWGHDTQLNRNVGLLYTGYDPAFERSWLDHYASINVRMPAMARVPVGHVYWADDIYSAEDLARTEYYNDWLQPQGLRSGIGVNLVASQERFFTVILDMQVQEEPYRDLLKSQLEQVAPHLTRAFALSRVFHNAVSIEDFEALVLHLPCAALTLDASGRVCLLNAPAKRCLTGQFGIVVRRDGTLGFEDGVAEGHAEELVRALRENRYQELAQDFLVRQPAGGSVRVSVVPLSSGGLRPAGALFPQHGSAAVLVLIDPDLKSRFQLLREKLATRYHLTAAEADLALSIARGESPSEIADQRRVSIHTVRNQLKSVFHKLEVNRQSQLVGVVSALLEQH